MMQAPTLEELARHWNPGEDITEQSHLHGFYEEFDSGGTKGIDPPKVINEVFPPGFEYGNYYKIYLVRGMLSKEVNAEEPKHVPEPAILPSSVYESLKMWIITNLGNSALCYRKEDGALIYAGSLFVPEP